MTNFAERPLAHQLPDNASTYIRALAKTDIDRLDAIDADIIRRLWNPFTCPEEDLPYLAWAFSVDIWNPDWPAGQKRIVCANALTDHQVKGTLQAVENYLGYEGASIDRAYVPPSRAFAVRGLTDEARAAYIAALPQIRIYPFEVTGDTPPKRAFMKGVAGIRSFAGFASMQTSHGKDLYGRRATVQMPGQTEVPADVEELPVLGQAPAEHVSVQFGGSKRTFEGHAFMKGRFMQATRASQNYVLVRLSDTAPSQFSALAGDTLQDVRPVRVNEIRTAPLGRGFIGRDPLGSKRAHMKTTAGPRQVYDRFALIDPTVKANLQPGRSFMGHARFGIAPYTAELRVEIPMHRPRWRAGVGRGQFMSGFIKKADMTPLDRSLTAIGAAKSFRDTILVDPEIYRTVRLGDGLKLGSFKLNQVIKRS